MEPGLAATLSGATNTYGTGEGQSTKHHYAGAGQTPKIMKKKKCKVKVTKKVKK